MESVDVQEVPGDTYSYEVFLPQTPEQFEYDADGNLTLDGVWVYEWDAENRPKAMWMRPEVAAIRLSSSYWVRLEFSYDYLGRRIAKKFLKGDGDTSWSVEKASQNMIWADNKIEKFAYDGWMPVAAYESSDVDGSFLRYTGSWAWGPDLSGTLGGAGGIGGLAIATDDLWDNEHPSSGVGAMVPVYDGNGNIQRLLRALDRQIEAKYEYGPFGETRSIDGPLGQHNPFRWSTKFTDAETGLVYYGYRYYSAGMGRWLNRDPLEEKGDNNLWRAFTNSPVQCVDQLGQSPTRFVGADAILLDFNFTVSAGFWVGGMGTLGMQMVFNCQSKEVSFFEYHGWGVGYTIPGAGFSYTILPGVGLVWSLPDNDSYSGTFQHFTGSINIGEVFNRGISGSVFWGGGARGVSAGPIVGLGVSPLPFGMSLFWGREYFSSPGATKSMSSSLRRRICLPCIAASVGVSPIVEEDLDDAIELVSNVDQETIRQLYREAHFDATVHNWINSIAVNIADGSLYRRLLQIMNEQ